MSKWPRELRQALQMFHWTVAGCVYMLVSSHLLRDFTPDHNAVVLPVIFVPAFMLLLLIGMFRRVP